MNFACRDEGVDARTPGLLQRAGRSLDIQLVRPRESCYLNPGELTTHRIHCFVISLRCDREPGFEDVDAEIDQLPCQPQLLGYGHATAGRLFTIAEGGVEDVNTVRHEFLLGFSLLSGCRDDLANL